jgi:predicted nucleotidyltransferase component of viral defense system
VAIQLVTDRETGGPPEATETRQGVLVVSLADLVRTKLRSGLDNLNRARDLADVVELIRHVPLDKRFAARLPREQRPAFEKLVEAVRAAPD